MASPAELAPAPATPASAWWRPVLVAAAAAAAFAAGLGGSFVWDDLAFLPPNPEWAAVSNPILFFKVGIFAFSRLDVPATVPIYRPLSTLVAWLVAPVLGDGATAWHVLPLVLHVVCSLLVYALARRWCAVGNPGAALAGGLLFAVLPCHAEAVAYISGWGHPLVTLLALLAVHAQLTSARRGSRGWLAVAATLATCALLSSEGALVLPPLLVGLDWVERRRPSPLTWAAYVLATAVPLYLRSRALTDPIPLQPTMDGFLRAASFGAAYVVDLVLPWSRSPYGSYPRAGVAGVGTWALSLAILAGAGTYVARIQRGHRVQPIMALAWLFAALAPIAAAGMNASPFFAPRALYMPSVGLALFVAALLARRAAAELTRYRWVLAVFTLWGVVIGNVSALGWRDEVTVLRRMLESDPEGPALHVKLASLLEEQGRPEEALRHFEAAERYAVTRSDRLLAREALGVHLGAAGRLEEAERLLSDVLREAPSSARALTNMGNVRLAKGDPAEARVLYERALALAPGNGEAAHNLAVALEALGDAVGAAAARRRAAAVGIGR